MRNLVLLAATTTLAACSGGGVQTVGSAAPPPAGGGQTGQTHSFVNPTEKKTYSTIGGIHKYNYSTASNGSSQGGQLYSGNASTARNSSITVAYDPRDAIFEVQIADTGANVTQNLRFQDPSHRTDFGGASQPQGGVPQLSAGGINYLQAGSQSANAAFGPESNTFPIGAAGASRNVSTFFYQKPGTETKYVTFAGYVRNATSVTQVQDIAGPTYLRQDHQLERAAFAYGERTASGSVPKVGTGTFTGAMVATAVYNPNFDIDPSAPTYFQWIEGRATTTVDFAASTFTVGLTGKVFAPQFDIYTSKAYTLQQDAVFNAAGNGRIDLVNAGGFLGQFTSASFTQPGGTKLDLSIAGSSVDGAFFGPAADEVGGGFRIVGGIPDQRIDVLGTFVGSKK